MHVRVCVDAIDLGQQAANATAEIIKKAIAERGESTIVVATGASQFETLAALVAISGIDWAKVTAFHLDEYVGLDRAHSASFCAYLQKRFVGLVDIGKFQFIDGEAADPAEECRRLNESISTCNIDVALVGIGENGHIAFNDPPADFDSESPYHVVALDEACRLQQVGEGWFGRIQDVPTHAISMSVKQIMKSANIICSVPDARKADAVLNTIRGDVTPKVPASILQSHEATSIFLDPDSASRLDAAHGRPPSPYAEVGAAERLEK